MKIYVQSKTGSHNCYIETSGETGIYNGEDVLRKIRAKGFYYDDKGRIVPFEEIEYVEPRP